MTYTKYLNVFSPEHFKLTSILRKTDIQVNFCYFLLKEVFFVQEQHNGSGCKALMVADAVEQMKAFMHSVLLRCKR